MYVNVLRRTQQDSAAMQNVGVECGEDGVGPGDLEDALSADTCVM